MAAEESAPTELILYGDIASETWWGDEVTPLQFTEELNALGRSRVEKPLRTRFSAAVTS